MNIKSGKMPWYSPWSDHITKRVCKYLLQRYLGQFLEEKLTLDQLNVDLYKGIGIISNVSLDVQALNDVAEQQNIPLEFLDGFVEEMSVSVPWSSILNDATYIEVKGLSLTIKQKEIYRTRASMFESMWSSMSSSMQLAEECLKNEKKEGAGKEDESSSFEGIEHFAQTIDSILSRIKVKFLDTTIRLEESVYNGAFGVAFELNIKLMDYADEAGLAPVEDAKRVHYRNPVFSTKKIYLEGVTIYSSEFCTSSRNKSYEDDNREDNNFEECSDSIILGRLSGRQEVTIKFKQEGMSGPKIELEISLGAFTVFTTPHQAHNLLELIYGVTSVSEKDIISGGKNYCPERKMEDSDYRKIEQELQMNMNPTNVLQPKGLTDQGWANMSLDKSDDEFTLLTNTSKLNSSVFSSATSLSGSTSSISSSKSSFTQSKPTVLRSKKPMYSGNADLDSSSVVFHFHVVLSSLAVILLHDDILTASTDSNEVHITKSSYEKMKSSAKEFFERLGHFAVVGYGHKDFLQAQELFSQACQKNHLRFLAAPIIIEGSETCTVNVSVIKGVCTAASLHLRECLFDKDAVLHTEKPEYVELLKFSKHCTNDTKDLKNAFESQPNLKLNFKLSSSSSKIENRKYPHPKSELSLVLQPCELEVDITIIDRISTLINKESFFGMKNPSNSGNCFGEQRRNEQSHLQQVVENIVPVYSRLDLSISSSSVVFHIRFPIPDFRPMHDINKPPWWKRSVRPDILQLDISDFVFHTLIKSQETVFKFETQFKDAIAKFKEGDCEKAVPFLRASIDPNSETLTEYDQALGCPRLVVHIFPANQSSLEENDTYIGYYKSSHTSMGQQSLITTLENTTKKEHSPFSCKKVIHESDTPHSKASITDQTEGEELVIPGDKAEIADFIDIASINTRIKLDLSLPSASLVFPSKHTYEVLYNRISSDFLLWEPSAPAFSNYSNYFDFNHWSVNDIINNFHLCKSSIQSESDSESESQSGSFYSAHEQKLRYKKKQLLQKNALAGQSKVVFRLNITQGLSDLYTPARDSQGNVIPGQHGQLHVTFDEGSLFLVSGYKGKPDLDYLCVQVNSFSVFHNGLISDTFQKYAYVGSKVPAYLQQLVYGTDKCTSVDQKLTSNSHLPSSLDMLTVSVRIERKGPSQSLKMFRVATGIRNATLRYIVCKGQTNWFTQMIDFFDVDDYPIAGHEPCSILTEINVHLYNCSVDYRPLYLPIRSLLTVGNFNISSNMAAQTNSSTLRFIAEEAAFFISDKTGGKCKYTPPDVRKDYVCVGDIGLFELSLRLSEKNQPQPKVDLRASGNVAHVWTCADSAKALAELLMYFASDGDFTTNVSENEEFQILKTVIANDEENVLIKTSERENSVTLSKSQVSLVIDLMEEAMKESKMDLPDKKAEGITKVIYFQPNEQKCVNISKIECVEDTNSLGSELESDNVEPLCDSADKEDSWENEFCILEHEAGLGLLPKKGLPEVRNLTGTPVRLVDNHFSVPLGKADLLRSPKHYPKPVLRYLLREMSVIWHMYGGSDFEVEQNNNKQVKIGHNVGRSGGAVSYSKNVSGLKFPGQSSGLENNIRWKERGGPKRRHDILMELQLNKIRFQHEVYPENTNEASRQVLLIQDMELRDRLATSTINKFLYQYTSEAKPKQSQAPMVIVKSVIMRSDPKLNAQECCLKVSLLPLRLNVDQDSVLFLYSFFSEISGDYKEEVDEEAVPKIQPNPLPTPVMSVSSQEKKNVTQTEPNHLLLKLENENESPPMSKSKKKGFSINNKQPSPPLFFRCFIFSPDVPVKLDYQGKRVDMTHGPLAGILMGLGQLNNSELKLRKISYKHGLLGFDKLFNFVLTEWTNDIKKNQLPSLLGGVGPMHSLVQLIQGIRDLFWLPIEQYQRDGRLVRGFQRGANSFTTSTAMACLELTSRVIQLIQTTAETAYDMVSPGPSVKSRRRGNGKRRRHNQPADIREGVTNAYLVVKEGIGETAETIVRVASEEHEQKGVTGAVGGVLRQIPPTVVKPIILATEATNNVIGGMRSQLVPDARKEAVEKWRKQDL